MSVQGNNRRQERDDQRRLRWFYIVIVVVFGLYAMRLLQVQLIIREKLLLLAKGQYETEVKIRPERGAILDRHLQPLAMNVPTVSVVANPKQIRDKDAVAQKIGRVLGKSAGYLRDKLEKNSGFVYLSRREPQRIGLLIEALGLSGIECQAEKSRQYPKGAVGCQLIGFTNVDGVGLSGIELSYEGALHGTDGRINMSKDAIGNSHLFRRADSDVLEAVDGANVVLTIDYAFQNIAHRELYRTLQESHADSGVVIIMDPKNGQVLAMASAPSFNPNAYGKSTPSAWRLRAITDQFEPGSTFKLVGLSMLLNEGLRKPVDRVFCENGKFSIMHETIQDVHGYGWLNLRDVVVHSSNIGMAKSVLSVDRRLLHQYARDFGFGAPTGIDLAGETGGDLPDLRDWSGFTPVAMSFGHNVAVSPLQMANLFCTIANGGSLLRPYVVKEIRDDDNRVLQRAATKVIRRVISEATADTIRNILYQVVERGTGSRAKLPGIEVCGKTGTARMVRPHGGGYIRGQYIASFGGFFPKDKPQLVIFVMIDDPKVGYMGGDVAAPCFARIARQIIYQRGIDIEAEPGTELDLQFVQDDHRLVPNFIGHPRSVAEDLADEVDLKVKIDGEGEVVTSQSPAAGTQLPVSATVRLACRDENRAEGVRQVPDVVGLPIRNAINVLAADGIRPVINGSGRVVTQQPPPGRRLRASEQVMLYCESSVDLRKLLIF